MSEVTSTNEEVIRRNLDKLRREMGDDIRRAMDDPTVIEIMLNPDGRVWIDKIGSGMEFSGSTNARHCRSHAWGGH